MARDLQLDAAKGVLIFFVVFGHLLEPVRGDGWGMHVYRLVYLFHMPGFILISGMLSSHRLDGDHVGKLASRLLVPLLVFECIGLAVHYAARGTLPVSVTRLQPAWTLWFFLSLFFWRLMAPVLLRFRYPVLASVVIALVGLSAEPVGTPLSLARTFSFLPFFMLGMVRGPQLMAALRQRSSWRWVLLAAAVLLVLLLFADHLNRRMLFGDASFPRAQLPLVHGLALRTVTWLLSLLAVLAVLRLVPATSWLAGWGRRSLNIYVWHAPLLIILREAVDWKALTGPGLPLFGGLLVLGVALCFVLSSTPVFRLTEALLDWVRRRLLQKIPAMPA